MLGCVIVYSSITSRSLTLMMDTEVEAAKLKPTYRNIEEIMDTTWLSTVSPRYAKNSMMVPISAT